MKKKKVNVEVPRKGVKSAGEIIKFPNKSVLHVNKGTFKNRVLVGTPTTGLVRVEWMMARYGNIIPTNWSHSDNVQFMSSYVPLTFQVPDAENLIAKYFVENDFEWLLFIESDNVIPQDTFKLMNEYMLDMDYPVVSGLYFTKSDPPEPMIYRSQGWGYFNDWKMGDKVMASGVPFGCCLIHGSLIRELWKISPEYNVGGTNTRRVFNNPSDIWYDPETRGWMKISGTSDLQFCDKLKKEGILEKAGWSAFQKKEYPYLVDTSIYVKHIDQQGNQWPMAIPEKFLPYRAGKTIE